MKKRKEEIQEYLDSLNKDDLITSINNNLQGRSKTCGGYIYEYE